VRFSNAPTTVQKSWAPPPAISTPKKNCDILWGCVGIITHAIHNWNSLSKLGVPPCAALQLIAQVTT
jgi:hypothetical protein